jgi:hypothetical protein
MLHSLYVQCLKIHLMKLISMKKQHESFHFNAVSEEPFHCRTNWLLHPTETPHILIQIKRLVHIMTQMILEKNQVFVCHALFKDFVYLILNVNNHSKKNFQTFCLKLSMQYFPSSLRTSNELNKKMSRQILNSSDFFFTGTCNY